MNMQCVCQFFPLSQSALTDCLRPFVRRISFFSFVGINAISHKLLQLQAMQRTSIDFHLKWRRWKYVTTFVAHQAMTQPTGVRRRWRVDITTKIFFYQNWDHSRRREKESRHERLTANFRESMQLCAVADNLGDGARQTPYKPYPMQSTKRPYSPHFRSYY